MRTLNSKVRKLYENTQNTEVKTVLNEMFSAFVNFDDSTTRNFLIQKVEKIENISENEKNFINSVKKITLLETLYLDELVSVLNENLDKFKKYPEFIYSLQGIKMLKENNAAYRVVEHILSAVESYKIVPEIETVINKISETVDKNKEDIYLLNCVYELRNMSNSYLYGDTIDCMEKYVYGEVPRNQMLSELKTLSHDKIFDNVYNQLMQLSNTFNIVRENVDYAIDDVRSFIFIDEKQNMYFTNKGKLFLKAGSVIENVDTNKIPSLLLEINNYIDNDNVKFTNGNILNVYLGENKIAIDVDNKSVSVNGVRIKDIEHLRPYIIETRLANSIYHNDITLLEKVYEYLPLLTNLDFAKNIKHRYSNDSATVFVVENNFYVNLKTADSSEFYSNLSLTKTQNLLKETLNFDLKGTSAQFLTEDKEITAIKVQQDNIKSEISELQERIYIAQKLPATDNRKSMLISVINERINDLNRLYSELNVQLETATHVNEDDKKKTVDKFKVGDTVRVINSGVIGKVTAINTNTKEYVVLTDENDTISVSVTQLVDVSAELSNNIKDVEDRAKQADGELKAQGVAESENKDDLTGYGVKGDLKADKQDDKEPINQESTFNKEDKAVLNDVVLKLTANINGVEDLISKLSAYNKINIKPLQDIVAKINAFKESVEEEAQSI